MIAHFETLAEKGHHSIDEVVVVNNGEIQRVLRVPQQLVYKLDRPGNVEVVVIGTIPARLNVYLGEENGGEFEGVFELELNKGLHSIPPAVQDKVDGHLKATESFLLSPVYTLPLSEIGAHSDSQVQKHWDLFLALGLVFENSLEIIGREVDFELVQEVGELLDVDLDLGDVEDGEEDFVEEVLVEEERVAAQPAQNDSVLESGNQFLQLCLD